MKANELPQDKSNLSSVNMNDLCYVVDENGNYTTKQSSGWSPKTLVLDKSLELIEERVQNIRQKVIDKELSPIVYYMELNRMDLSVLAAYFGKWKWIVKRHFKPSNFDKLSSKSLKKYANIFNIGIDELKDITK